MSRGLGRIERALLAEVTPRWGMVVLIGERLYGENPTDVQLVGLRRAARSLAAKGLIELKHGGVEVGTSRWTGWPVHRCGNAVRLPGGSGNAGLFNATG